MRIWIFDKEESYKLHTVRWMTTNMHAHAQLVFDKEVRKLLVCAPSYRMATNMYAHAQLDFDKEVKKLHVCTPSDWMTTNMHAHAQLDFDKEVGRLHVKQCLI